MSQWSTWVRSEREALGLSTRQLGRLAGISYPTISRIENDHEQPRLATLEKLSKAFGKSLVATFEPAPIPRLARLVGAWTHDALGDVLVDWTRWRGFVDHVQLHPETTAAAIAEAPVSSGSSLVDNLLAATAEKLAEDAGIGRPSWTYYCPPLMTPWSAPATPRKHAVNVERTPAQFASRNITLPATALWRDRDQVRT